MALPDALGFWGERAMAFARGWRLSAAARCVRSRPCAGGHCEHRSSCEHWKELKSYLIGLSSVVDQASRVCTLKSLAALLLCLASGGDPANAADQDYAVSVPVGGTVVYIAHEDVMRLYKLLFGELSSISSYLLTDMVEDPAPCEVSAQILCCCIRIIPIVDMFNTSLGHSASLAVNELLQQLCSISTVLPQEHRHIILRNCLLEVFLEEILLQACPFLTDGDDNHELAVQSGGDIQSQASIEAAFAHMCHHHFLKSQIEKNEQQVRVGNLSLPAGVLLLDMSTVNWVPRGFLTHIFSLVAGALFPSDLASEMEHGSFLKKIQNGDPQLQLDELPNGVAIGLASSVVETAMGILSKRYSASLGDSDSIQRSGFQAGSSSSGYDFNDCESLLAALLRAMAAAIIRIVREVLTIKSRPSNETELPIRICGGLEEGLAIRRALDSVATAISFNLPSRNFMQAIGCFEQDMVDALASENAGGIIGWTLVIFAHIMCYEAQRGLNEVLAMEYLRVLDSLMGLLRLENDCRLESNSDNSCMLDGLLHSAGAGERVISTDYYLHQMIKSLQRTVWDMCSRKKPTSKLLSFISKVSPPRGLSPPPLPEIVNYAGSSDCTSQVEESQLPEQPRGAPVPVQRKPRPSAWIIAKRFKQRSQQRRNREMIIDIFDDDVVEAEVSPSEGGPSSYRETRLSKKRKQEICEATKENQEVCEATKDNPFIIEMLEREKYDESFDDLTDFIVCKEGRCYSKYLNWRIKYRRMNHTRLIWRRREEKRNLLRLLNVGDDP